MLVTSCCMISDEVCLVEKFVVKRKDHKIASLSDREFEVVEAWLVFECRSNFTNYSQVSYLVATQMLNGSNRFAKQIQRETLVTPTVSDHQQSLISKMIQQINFGKLLVVLWHLFHLNFHLAGNFINLKFCLHQKLISLYLLLSVPFSWCFFFRQ